MQRGELGHMTAQQEAESSPSTTTATSTPIPPPLLALASIRHIRSWGLFIEQAYEWAVECSVLAVQGSHATGIRRVRCHATDLSIWREAFTWVPNHYHCMFVALIHSQRCGLSWWGLKSPAQSPELLPQHKPESFGLSPVVGVFRATSFCSPRPSGRSLSFQTSSPSAPTLMTSMKMPKTCLVVRWVTVAVINIKWITHPKTCFHILIYAPGGRLHSSACPIQPRTVGCCPVHCRWTEVPLMELFLCIQMFLLADSSIAKETLGVTDTFTLNSG